MAKPIVYSAAHISGILGLLFECKDPVPRPREGEIVIYYGGWSLQELRDSAIGKQFMEQQEWYNHWRWSNATFPTGYYGLRIPVPNSNRKSFPEQKQSLHSGEQAAAVVLVATALLVHCLQATDHLLNDDWIRCKEQAVGNHVILHWNGGRLYVCDYWDDCRSDNLWLASAWTSRNRPVNR